MEQWKEMSITSFTYIIESQGYYKIGCTRDISKRFIQYRTYNPCFSMIRVYGETIKQVGLESKIQKLLKSKVVHGEWFILTQEDIEKVDSFVIKNKRSIVLDGTHWRRCPSDNSTISGRLRLLYNNCDNDGFVNTNILELEEEM